MFGFTKKQKKNTEFSHFMRNASSRERKKVFKRVLDKATDDQIKILNKA